MYTHHSAETIQRVNPNIWDPRFYYLRQLRKVVEQSLSNFNLEPKMKVLDVGCGSMPYKNIVEATYNVEYLGADIILNPNRDITINEYGIIDTNMEFDAVISTQVLEHVPDPQIYLKEIHRILKPEGKILLTTHGIWMYHPDPTDYWRWTSMGLKKIVSASGLKIESFQGIIGRTAMGLQLTQDGVYFKLPKLLKPFFSVFFQLLIRLADNLHSQSQKDEDACTFVVVAKK